jgi:hypothetical protein
MPIQNPINQRQFYSYVSDSIFKLELAGKVARRDGADCWADMIDNMVRDLRDMRKHTHDPIPAEEPTS